MSEISTRATAHLDAAQQLQRAQQQARQRELEDERQKTLVGSVQPQAAAAQAQAQAKPDDAATQAVGAASAQKEASRLEDSARRFNAPNPSQLQRAPAVEASQEAVRVAAFARARDPVIKG